MKQINHQVASSKCQVSRLATCYLLLVTCSLLLAACTSVIQVSVPNGSQLLVVDAFLDNSYTPQKVRLTFNASYFSNVPTPPVLGATVSLSDLTNSKTYTFTPDGNGNYIYYPIFNDSMTQVHHKYQLTISYNNNTYTALSTLNRTTPVDSIIFRNSGRDEKGTDPPSDTTKPRKFFPLVIAKDSTGKTPDYYWMKVFNNGAFYNQSSQINAFQDGGYQGTDGYPFLPPVAFFGLTNDNNPIYRNDVCTVEIYSINENTLSYLGQLRTQLTNSQNGLFAVTPQNVKTNIQQVSGTLPASGWFNIGAISSKSAIAK